MKYRAKINIMPQEALLDPQGKAVTQRMAGIGLPEIQGVRIGKHIQLQVEAEDEADAARKVEKACEDMLVNKITESYEYQVEEVQPAE